jgi:SnoaL-like domain
LNTPSLAELAAQVQQLLDLEQIKQLKYRYFRCFDTADMAGIAAVFHPDVTLEVNGGVYRFRIEGRDKYLNMVRDGAHSEMIMQHNGHHPEIELISATEARGIWYLQDAVWEFRRSRRSRTLRSAISLSTRRSCRRENSRRTLKIDHHRRGEWHVESDDPVPEAA